LVVQVIVAEPDRPDALTAEITGGTVSAEWNDAGAAGGFGAESYSRYLTSILQNAIEGNDKLNHLAFNAQVTAWVDGNRRLHVRLLQSSGDPKIDDNIVAAAQQLPTLDEEPPGALQFRLAIHSKRPA